MRTEWIKMKSKLRKLEENSPYHDLFDSYEREQNILANEVERLLNLNSALEERLSEEKKEDDGKLKGKGNSGAGLKKALQEAKMEIKDLTVANIALKKQERVTLVQQHALETNFKKTQQISK